MVSTSTKTLDREFGPHVPMSKETVNTVALKLLNRREKSLETKTAFPDRFWEVRRFLESREQFGGKE